MVGAEAALNCGMAKEQRQARTRPQSRGRKGHRLGARRTPPPPAPRSTDPSKAARQSRGRKGMDTTATGCSLHGPAIYTEGRGEPRGSFSARPSPNLPPSYLAHRPDPRPSPASASSPGPGRSRQRLGWLSLAGALTHRRWKELGAGRRRRESSAAGSWVMMDEEQPCG